MLFAHQLVIVSDYQFVKICFFFSLDSIIERYKTECLVEGLSLARPLDSVSSKYLISLKTFCDFFSNLDV